MNFPILSAIIFIPLIGALFIFITKGPQKNVEKAFQEVVRKSKVPGNHKVKLKIRGRRFRGKSYDINMQVDDEGHLADVDIENNFYPRRIREHQFRLSKPSKPGNPLRDKKKEEEKAKRDEEKRKQEEQKKKAESEKDK